MSLPTTSKWVRTDLLHPTFKARLHALLNQDSRISGKVKIVSGVRSYADQKRLYDGWVARKPGFNLAANPDRTFAPGWTGSYHMQQKFDGFGHAVDLRITGSGLTTGDVARIAKDYGIRQTVLNPFEWWHFQWRNTSGIFPAPAMEGKPTETKTAKKKKVDLKGVGAAIAMLGEQVRRQPLRKGSKNSAVKVVQAQLNNLGFQCGFADGIFGRKTQKAVRKFQLANGLVADAIVGALTWNKLFSKVG
tara:strand:+ start:1502 stop:2242 length:741 start_codon:yes stop_codon:yes gene_type:complete